MAFSKITRIILWVVAGISILVMGFYYIGPKTLDADALDQRVQEALMPTDLTISAPLPVIDTTLTDSVAIAENKAEVQRAEEERRAAIAEAADEPLPKVADITTGWEYLVYFRADIALIWAYILVILTMIASIVFPLIHVFSNPKGLIRLVLVLVGAAVIVVISYLLSKDTPITITGYTGTGNTDPVTLKLIDTVIFITYMLFGLALASILYSVISRAFK
jgi:hypothetical protein